MKLILKIITVSFFILTSCKLDQGKIEVTLKNQGSKTLDLQIAQIKVLSNQLVVDGSNLNNVTNVKVVDTNDQLVHTFAIDTKSNSQLILNASSPLTFITKNIFKLILSSANAAATYTIDFSLCDAKIGNKLIDCTVIPQDGYVLAYDNTTDKWKPKSLSGMTYLGTFDASGGSAPSAQPAGSYYVISVAGTISAINFDVGDWIVSNGSAYQKIDNSTSVASVFGRLGAVTAQEGDYNLDKLSDVDLTIAPTNGQALVYDTATSKWKAATVASGSGGGGGPYGSGDITDGSLTAADLADGTITGAKIANNTITLDKLNGTSDTTKYLRGDKTWADFRPGVLATPLTGLTSGTGSVAATDTVLQAFGKLLSVPGDYVSKSSGASITTGTIALSGTALLTVPTATGATSTEVTNVQYVQNYVDNAFSSGGAYAPNTLTTVSGAHASGDTTLTVVSTSGYPSSGNLIIGNEIISYSGKTSGTFTGLTRGAFGSTAAAISTATIVNNILIMARTTTTSAPNFVVTGAGNVGVGRRNPTTRLHVAGGLTAGAGPTTPAINQFLAMGATDDSMFVANTSSYPDSGTLLIESELINYTHKDNEYFLGLTRGAFGTAASIHGTGNNVHAVLGNFSTSASATPALLVLSSGNIGFGALPTDTSPIKYNVNSNVGTGNIKGSDFTLNYTSPNSGVDVSGQFVTLDYNSSSMSGFSDQFVSGSRTYVTSSGNGFNKPSHLIGSRVDVNNGIQGATSSSGLLVGNYQGGGTITDMHGIYVLTNPHQIVTNSYGLRLDTQKTAGGAITNSYGLHVRTRNTGPGSIANSYGLFVDTIQGTSKWSIYANDSTAPSYFSANVGIGTTTPSNKLQVAGNIHATGQLSTGATTITGGTSSINFDSGNIISTDYDCASNISMANLKSGGTYTLVVRGTGTTQCNFSTTTTGVDAGTVSYRFKPSNASRDASSHSIYTLMRVGNVVYVSWTSGF